VAPSQREQARVSLQLHADLLDPWCWIAERRVAAVAEAYPGRFAIEFAPFPRRWDLRLPSARERAARTRALERAAREKDAPPLSSDLWSSPSPPASGAPALVAVAAAQLQGAIQARALRDALRDAALVRGLDVSRTDVIVELASRDPMLDLARFVSALRAPGTERQVRAAFDDALDKGIESAPALVVGDEWLVGGVRSAAEYHDILQRYLNMRAGVPTERTVH
jgi:predicted DsbA family dithiol-disulfide isomerase